MLKRCHFHVLGLLFALLTIAMFSIRLESLAASSSGDQGSLFENESQNLAPPVITGINPSAPQTSVTDQTIVIKGSNFVPGLTVTVFFPGGGTGVLSGSQIQNVTPSSFSIRVTLNAAGTWCFRANSPGGEQSNTFCFTVVGAQAPTISSINPSSPPTGNLDQNVGVTGTNFQAGLTITVFFPGGGSTTLSGAQVVNVSPTSLTMVITLNVQGQYGIRINNPSSLQSNTFQFSTQTVTPGISAIQANCASNIDRPISVTGSNFFPGLSVAVTFPSGGGTVLTGSQIQNVTQTSFTMVVTLATPGMWAFRVINPGGSQSGPFSAAIGYCLTSSSISPSVPIRGNIDQNVTVSGSNFQPGLNVILVFPSGGSTTLSGSQIVGVTPTSFVMKATLNAAGGWEMQVRNPNGDISNPLTFNVKLQTRFDFDRDGKTDLGIFRPAPAEWWINRSSNGTTFATQFGSSTDRLVPGDYTGDGTADIAIWRPSSGEWIVLRSEDFSYYSLPFGTSGDIPSPGDYDGDGKDDYSVFRPSTSIWYVQRSAGGTFIAQFGANGDLPMPADYDGDGKSDIAIYRPSVGQWWINRSTAGVLAFGFGNSSDKPVPGDYTGDGRADTTFWRPSTGEWFVLRSEDFSYYASPFGANGDIPVPGDYDGDGKQDSAVFRPPSATWFVQKSTSGILIQQFGLNGDRPIPGSLVQ